MSISSETHQARLLGWCAIRRLQVNEWLKGYTTRIRPHSANQPLQQDRSLNNQHGDRADSMSALNEEKKLSSVVKESHNILVQTNSLFPFQMFPTNLTLDRHKLTIVYRKFFKAEQTVSVPIEDIKNIQADVGPFLGSLTITSDLFINNTQKVDCLRRSDVIRVQRIVQGAMVAIKEGINISKISTDKLKDLLVDLGKGNEDNV